MGVLGPWLEVSGPLVDCQSLFGDKGGLRGDWAWSSFSALLPFPLLGGVAGHSGGILVGDYLLGGRTTNNQLRTGTDKVNLTV